MRLLASVARRFSGYSTDNSVEFYWGAGWQTYPAPGAFSIPLGGKPAEAMNSFPCMILASGSLSMACFAVTVH